mgnify:CR=1 FL=1
MTSLATWLPPLVDTPSGTVLDRMELDLPVELRVTARGVELRLPSQRLPTGFDAPIGRLRAVVERSGDGA